MSFAHTPINIARRNSGNLLIHQEMVKREIESMDRGIDGLVYELYGLSEEEIRIVEGN